MAIHAMQGLMGAGKSCVAVNKFLVQWLTESRRHIYTNLPLTYVGEVGALAHEPRPGWFTFLLLFLGSLFGRSVRRAMLRRMAAQRRERWQQRKLEWLAACAERPPMLQIVANATRNHARREEMMGRIHFLRPKVLQPLDEAGEPLTYLPLDEDGEPLSDAEPQVVGPKHQVREFWYFTRPNAVVFLDEVADIWPTETRKDRPETMKSYIRHHRHYKDDLYFFFQDKEDIDPDLRRKIQYLWTVRNSTKENIFDHWALRGLRWPLLFFKVRCYLGRSVVGVAEEAMKRYEPQEAWNFWPTKRDFATYRSFSQASTLPGKKSASATARSTDFDPSLWGKVRAFVENLGPVLAVGGALVTVVVMWIFGIRWMAEAAGGTSKFAPSPATDARARRTTPQSNAPAGTAVTELGDGRSFLAVATNAPTADEPERLVMVSPGLVRTNKRTYAKGDELGGGRVDRILLNGVVLEDGRGVTWDLLFPGQRRDAGRRR